MKNDLAGKISAAELEVMKIILIVLKHFCCPNRYYW